MQERKEARKHSRFVGKGIVQASSKTKAKGNALMMIDVRRVKVFLGHFLGVVLMSIGLIAYAHPNATLHHNDLDVLLGGFKGTPLGDIAYEVSDSIDNEMIAWFRQKYGSVPGNHRLFSHGHTLGEAIPRELLDAINQRYGKQAVDDVIRRQQEIAGRYLKKIMDTTGLQRKQASGFLRQFSNSHLLGDLMEDNKLINLVKDFDSICESEVKIVDDLFGKSNPEYAEALKSEIKTLKKSSLPVAQKAEKLTQLFGKYKVDAAVNRAYGNVFKRTAKPFSYSIDRAINRNARLLERQLAKGLPPVSSPKIRLSRIGSQLEKGVATAAGRSAARAASRSAARSVGRSVSRAVGQTVTKGAAKAGGRGLLSRLGTVAPILVDVGFWAYGDYKIEDEYTRGLISETERVEKKYRNNGRAIGGGLGAVGGAALAKSLTSDSNGEGGSVLAMAAFAIIGGLIGESAGEEVAETVYETVNRPPYEVCREACEIGDVDAMFFNGLYHHEGRYVTRNLAVANEWFAWAACQGDVRAQFYRGESSYSSDVGRSVFWWSLAANSQSSETKFKECKAAAAYNLAVAYMTGEGVEQDDLTAISYLMKAANEGNETAKAKVRKLWEDCSREFNNADPDPKTLTVYGDLYVCSGNEEMYTKAYECYHRAAELGDVDALCCLGYAYELGRGVEKDLSKAISLYQWAADLGQPIAINHFIRLVNSQSAWKENIDWLIEKANEEDGSACSQLAIMALISKNDASVRSLLPFKDVSDDERLDMAIKLFERAEDAGSDDAKLSLAVAFEHDLLRTKLTDSSANTYSRRLFELSLRNNVNAQLMYARACERGGALVKNLKTAAFYYALAAINGNAEAQCEFGKCCFTGQGVPKNLGNAMKWLRKSADQGNAKAILTLAKCYGDGKGVAKDDDKAYELTRKASELASSASEVDSVAAKQVVDAFSQAFFNAEPYLFVQTLPDKWQKDLSDAAAVVAEQLSDEEWNELQKVVDLFGRCLVKYSDMIDREIRKGADKNSWKSYKSIIENWGEKLCGVSVAFMRKEISSSGLIRALRLPKQHVHDTHKGRKFQTPSIDNVKQIDDIVLVEVSDREFLDFVGTDLSKRPDITPMRRIEGKLVMDGMESAFEESSSWKVLIEKEIKKISAEDRRTFLKLIKDLSNGLKKVLDSNSITSIDEAGELLGREMFSGN